MAEILLDREKLDEELIYLKFWKEEDKALVRNIEFKDFMEAVQFVTLIANAAEEMDHHPDICVFNYKWVKVTLTTHKAGGITNKDIELAHRVDELFELETSK